MNFSSADPDARPSIKHVERGQFVYFEHRIVDTRHGFILVTEMTAANEPSHQILLQQVDEFQDLFGSYKKQIELDAGYYNAYCAKALFEPRLFWDQCLINAYGQKNIHTVNETNFNKYMKRPNGSLPSIRQ